MTAYVYVENGKILEGPIPLPSSWRNISGLDGLDAHELALLGWVPYITNDVALESNEAYGESILDFYPDKVVETRTKMLASELDGFEADQQSEVSMDALSFKLLLQTTGVYQTIVDKLTSDDALLDLRIYWENSVMFYKDDDYLHAIFFEIDQPELLDVLFSQAIGAEES